MNKNLTVPMRWAAEHGNVPAVRACLESGVDVDKVLTSDNRTALHVAALNGRAALAKALIEAGADVNKPASPNTVSGNPVHNVTPLYLAADQGHTHVVMELIKAGADLNQANLGGLHPALHSRSKWARWYRGLAHPSRRGRSQGLQGWLDADESRHIYEAGEGRDVVEVLRASLEFPSRRSMKRHRGATNHHAPSLSTYPHAASASRPRFADATNAYIVKLLEQFRA